MKLLSPPLNPNAPLEPQLAAARYAYVGCRMRLDIGKAFWSTPEGEPSTPSISNKTRPVTIKDISFSDPHTITIIWSDSTRALSTDARDMEMLPSNLQPQPNRLRLSTLAV